MKQLGKYTPWKKFDPWEYAQRNYGKMLPEDRLIIQGVAKSFEEIGVAEKQFDIVADLGTGPNLYPAMLLAPFVKDSGKISLIEYASSNRKYLKKVLHTFEEGKVQAHQDNWKNYGRQIERICGEQYKRCYERARKLVVITEGNIYELEPNQFSAVSSFFTIDGITDRYEEFLIALTSAIGSLKFGGVFVFTHMLGSKGYYAGEGTNFPAVDLSIDDLEKAYSLTNLDFATLEMKEVRAGDDEDKAREGYHGMAYVVGRIKG